MAGHDDERAVRRPVHDIGQDLSALSVDELGERIALLNAEIARLEAAKSKKAASRDAANSIFKS